MLLAKSNAGASMTAARDWNDKGNGHQLPAN